MQKAKIRFYNHASMYGFYGLLLFRSTSDSESMLYGKVTGIITDVSSSPLEGVSVVVDESGLTATDGGATAVTNAQGEFTSRKYFNRYP